MKTKSFGSFFVIFSLLLLLSCTSCSGGNHHSSIKLLSKNHMDFPELENTSFNGIEFKLSRLFTKDTNSKYTIHKYSFSRKISDINVFFSFEKFTKKEAKKFQLQFSDDNNLLNSVSDYYIIKRGESLYNPYISIKKNVPKSVKYKGNIQVVEGAAKENEFILTYFTSTLKIGEMYYVFQLIGPKDNMGYLHDDFLDLLSSVKKKK